MHDNEWGVSNRLRDTGLPIALSMLKQNLGVAA
jgi:hypothetical protein